MKLKELAFANALAITAGIVFVVCRFLVMISPALMFAVGQSWFHGIRMTPMNTWGFAPTLFILGLITSIGFAWLTGYLIASIYNSLLKR